MVAIAIAIPKVVFLCVGMEIKINNQLKNFVGHTAMTVQQLLDLEIPEKQKGIAVAICNKVVSKTEWDKTTISSGDDILIIKATQGG